MPSVVFDCHNFYGNFLTEKLIYGKYGEIMERHRMFKLVREKVEEVPGLEKWSLKQLLNPEDPNTEKISPIKIAAMSKIFGEFQIGNTILAITQEHRFGQPPLHICFSLQMEGIRGNSIIYAVNNGAMALLDGELGSPDGKMYKLPSSPEASQAVFEWIEKLSDVIYWE